MPGRRQRRWALGVLGLLAAAPGIAQGATASADPFAHCEQALAEAPTAFRSARCFHQVARSANLWDAARERLRSLVAAHPELPWLRFYFASVAMDRGEPEAADVFRQAADAFAEAGDAAGETYARINRARLLDGAGALEAALEEVGAASRAASRSDDPGLDHEVRLLELRIRFRRGDERVVLGHALRALEQSLGREASYSLKRDVSNLQGAVAFELGEYADALAHYDTTAALAGDAGDAPTEAAMALNALHVSLARESAPTWHAEATARAERALALAARAGAPAVEASARLTIGRLLDDPEQLEAGLEIARRTGDAGLEREALGFLAMNRLDDDPQTALALAESALEASARDVDPLAAAEGWHAQFAVRWHAAGPESALAHADRVFDLLERISRSERDDTGSARLFSVWAEAYHWLAGMLFEDHLANGDRASLARGFEVLERMRAWRHGAGAEAFAITTLDALEASLDDRQAFVSMQSAAARGAWGVFAGGSWLTISTQHGTRLFRIPDRSALEARIAMFLALVERRDAAEIDAGQALFGDLFEAAVASIPASVDRLTLALDGALSLIPFAALRTANGTPFGGAFVLEQTPSASMWRHVRSLDAPAPAAGALAIVDPRTVRNDSLAAWPERAGALAPLPSAVREGRALCRTFGRACRVLAGSDAGEGAIKTAIGSAAVVHVAAHGLVDSRSPERSAIVVAPSSGEDGLLDAREIARLGLEAPLVVLSTCESAAGPLLRGEGTMSLSGAFLSGGARTVVGSLWRLRDREAAALFERFYRHLRAGATVAGALQQAQADRRRAGDPAHAWAGLAVIGDGDWVPVARPIAPHRRRFAIGLGVVAALALLALALAARRR